MHIKKNQSQSIYTNDKNSHYGGKKSPNKINNNTTNLTKNVKTKNFHRGSHHQVLNSLQTAIQRSTSRSNLSRSPDYSNNQKGFSSSNKSNREHSSSSGSHDFVMKKVNYSIKNINLDEDSQLRKNRDSRSGGSRDKSAKGISTVRHLGSAWSFTSEADSTNLEKIPFK